MTASAFAITHCGSTRKENEDFFLIDEDLKLYIVSDGITHAAGAKCSREVCESIRDYLRGNRKVIEANEKASTSTTRQTILNLLRVG